MRFLTILPLLAALATASPNIIPRTIPTTLSVENFIRNCSIVDTCDYKFTIDYAPYGKGSCTIHDVKVKDGKDVTLKEFFGVGCIENPQTWEISWGWNYDQDFTVMTVVNKPNNYRGYFGYSHPNAGLPVVAYSDISQPVIKKSEPFSIKFAPCRGCA
ncbi:hypothetical protein GLAREA_12856 [Glarea lozoyensis ATCC 20868]|uniref:Uncharacterized protein n=2 Tax=Glarea lozoyensis TaxID=101852 RepID=S3DUM8_GLAL2|nr:uncharacterized protein GLAREA_12856 [Glarea lozoyensis ATCC 20868]EHK96561.1 hypothetical protein M7I_7733 [Glarea lozoyensis 74030]EPE30133.1 hypothetical protein GLAREA_12856 [Glarea lozoyensis ATCC 20868]